MQMTIDHSNLEKIHDSGGLNYEILALIASL